MEVKADFSIMFDFRKLIEFLSSQTNLNSTEKLVLLYLVAYSKTNPYVKVTNTQIFHATNTSYTTVNRALVKLESIGLITRVFTDEADKADKRIIRINFDYIKDSVVSEP